MEDDINKSAPQNEVRGDVEAGTRGESASADNTPPSAGGATTTPEVVKAAAPNNSKKIKTMMRKSKVVPLDSGVLAAFEVRLRQKSAPRQNFKSVVSLITYVLCLSYSIGNLCYSAS